MFKKKLKIKKVKKVNRKVFLHHQTKKFFSSLFKSFFFLKFFLYIKNGRKILSKKPKEDLNIFEEKKPESHNMLANDTERFL